MNEKKSVDECIQNDRLIETRVVFEFVYASRYITYLKRLIETRVVFE